MICLIKFNNKHKLDGRTVLFLLYKSGIQKSTLFPRSYTTKRDTKISFKYQIIVQFFCFLTDRLTDKQTDICECRVTFATENKIIE